MNSPYPGRDPTASLLFGDDPSFGLSVKFGAQLLQILLELEGGACVAHGTHKGLSEIGEHYDNPLELGMQDTSLSDKPQNYIKHDLVWKSCRELCGLLLLLRRVARQQTQQTYIGRAHMARRHITP